MNLLGKVEAIDRVILAVEPSDRFARKISKELNQYWNVDGLFSHHFHPDDDYDPKLLLEGRDGFNDEPRNRLKGKTVYLVASHQRWEPSLLFERICHTADICRSNGAKEVNLIWTNVRNSGNHLRPGQNNKFSDKELIKYDGKSLSTKRIARRLKFEGISKVLTLHTHSKNIVEAFGEEFFDDIARGKEVFKDLTVAPIIAHYLYISGKIKNTGKNTVFVSTDEGSQDLGIEILNNIQKLDPSLSDISWVQFRKERDASSGFLKDIMEDETSDNYTGHEGKDKFIFDDIVRSFASMYGVIEKMGGDNFTMFATHAHLTGKAQSLLAGDKIKEIIFTNTMAQNLEDPYYKHSLFSKTTVLKVGDYFANAIVNILEDNNDCDTFYNAHSPSDIVRLGKLYGIRKDIK